MNLTAGAFLLAYGSQFHHSAVADWQWQADDEIFGKNASWSLDRSPAIDARATVDLTAGQLQLTITERPLDGDSADSEVVFGALVSFDDRSLTIDGIGHPYDEKALSALIESFNERA